MRPQTCRLAELLVLPCSVALGALHREAEALAGVIRSREPGLEVSVVVDEGGAVVRIAGPGLAAREHGSPGAAPAGSVIDLAEHGAGIADAVDAAVATALGRR